MQQTRDKLLVSYYREQHFPIQGPPHFPSLTSLTLTASHHIKTDHFFFEGTIDAPRLRDFTSDGVPIFPSLLSSPALRRVVLDGQKYPFRWTKVAGFLAQNPSIEHIKLYHHVDSRDFSTARPTLPNLKSLFLLYPHFDRLLEAPQLERLTCFPQTAQIVPFVSIPHLTLLMAGSVRSSWTPTEALSVGLRILDIVWDEARHVIDLLMSLQQDKPPKRGFSVMYFPNLHTLRLIGCITWYPEQGNYLSDIEQLLRFRESLVVRYDESSTLTNHFAPATIASVAQSFPGRFAPVDESEVWSFTMDDLPL
ncbi:hypothetical protein DL93DRAFT_2168144 [Clavulina sp. PMI_390]|nr:hypothetical protein DL93DRAFT_2168144 [Clavulina sp. PMI_390]